MVGPRTSSHGGTYVVRRKGLLDEIPHVRRIRGVAIVRTKDARRVVVLLEGVGAEVRVWGVEMTRRTRGALGGNVSSQKEGVRIATLPATYNRLYLHLFSVNYRVREAYEEQI